MRPELLKQFPAALLGRLVVVPYYPIAPEILRRIIRLQLDRIREHVRWVSDSSSVPAGAREVR